MAQFHRVKFFHIFLRITTSINRYNLILYFLRLRTFSLKACLTEEYANRIFDIGYLGLRSMKSRVLNVLKNGF